MIRLLRGALLLCLLAAIAGVVPQVQGADDADTYRLYLESTAKMNQGDFKGAIDALEKLHTPSAPSHILLRLSSLYVKTGQPDKAEATLREAIDNEPDDAELLFEMGRLKLFEMQEPENALQWFERAVEKDPEVIEYRIYLAQAYAANNRPADAVIVYDRIIDIDPKSDYYVERGWLKQRMGLVKNAVKDYEKAIDIDGSLSARINIADIYIETNEHEKAVEMLEEVHKADDTLVLPALKLADLYREDGQLEKAMDVYRSLLDSPRLRDRGYILNRLATLHYEEKEYEEALEYFKLLNEENPDDIQSYYFVGYMLEIVERYDEAADYYRRALSLRSDYAEVRKRLAIVNLKLDKAKAALEAIEGIIPIDRDIDYYRLAAIAQSRLGDVDAAIAVLNEGLKENPASEDLLFELAIAHEKRQEFDAAIDNLKKAISYNPENPVFLNFLGYLYADLDRNLDEAEELIGKALEYDPDNPAYLDSMAWVLYRQGEYEKAFDFQKRALVAMPDEAEIVEHMKAILEKLGNPTSVERIINESN